MPDEQTQTPATVAFAKPRLPDPPKWLTEGVLIASVPIAAYFAAYRFELGYFTTFGIPAELITIDVGTFLEVGAAAYALLAALGSTFMFLVIELLPSSKPRPARRPWNKPSLRAYCVFSALFIAGLTLHGTTNLLRAIILPVPAIALYFTLRFAARDVESPPWKIHAAFWMQLTLFVSVLLCTDLGRSKATNRKVFPVVAAEPTKVILRRSGETIIVCEYDPGTKVLGAKFEVRSFPNESITVELRSIGPLFRNPNSPVRGIFP